MAKTHISELPNEVLVEIFTELKDNSLIETWHKIASVCRHWRAVAVEAASLWTRPPTAHHDYTLLMLERSRTNALEISLGHWTDKATTTAVLQHLQRISTLSICDQPHQALNGFQNTLLDTGHKASRLRSLHIQDASSPPFRLSATTFLEPTSLKSLRLVSIDIDWALFPIRSLTSLSLEYLRMETGPSWIQFLKALRNMPLLEDLCFSFRMLRLNSPPVICESLQMASLRKLTIKSSQPSVIRPFLLATTFPQLQEVHIECSGTSQSGNLHSHSPVINATLSLVTKGDFSRLDRVEVGPNRFVMSQISPLDWKSRRTLEFACPHDIPGSLAQDAMAGISALPGNRVADIINVVCYTKLPPRKFVDFFGRMPQLELLRSCVCLEVIESLKILPTHPSDLPIPFSSLKKLTLDEGNSGLDLRSSLVEELYETLMTRRKHGAEIQELCINYLLTNEEAQLLQKSVSNLEFWGYRKPGDEFDDRLDAMLAQVFGH